MIKKAIKQALRPLFGKLRHGNVVMFHLGRCGSTVLGSLLGQHPRIYWDGEVYFPIFSEWQRKNRGVEIVGDMPEDPIKLLRRRMHLAYHRFYGFEIKPFHLRLIRCPAEPFIHHLDSLGFTHFIILDRMNRLRIIISALIAHEDSTKYHQKSGTDAKLTRLAVNTDEVRIDFEAKPLLDYLMDYDKQFNSLQKLLHGRQVLKLTYDEDIQKDPKRAYLRVCEFLGLEAREVSVWFSKVNPFSVKNMIVNFEEVERALCGTPYEWMLRD